MIIGATWLNEIGVEWFNESVYSLLLRLAINFIVLTVIIRFIYYPKTRRKDYLFTYFLIGLITFFLCFALKKLEINLGMGLGLFAIFGIIRYRTNAIEIKEMTYLFVIIGLSVVNSLAKNEVSMTEILIINGSVALLCAMLEFVWLIKHEARKTIIYERIDLITPSKHRELHADLEKRTGITINRFEIGKIDFLNDTAQIRIYYFADEQELSDYSAIEGE